MPRINAFVGHSFTKNDEEIVRKFLQYFDQVSNLIEDFSWAHAETAEPRELTKKVLELIEDKNLFIGICTKKELALDSADISRVPFSLRALVKSDKLQWKTSDWIIQEIGLAKGRNMDLLLLIEEGVRKPGGLQGDVEYINFDREAPERAFGKILEMITALNPKAMQQLSTSSAPTSTKENIEIENSSGNELTVASPSWGQEEYNLALFIAISKLDNDKIATIDTAFRASPFGKTPQSLAIWDSDKIFFQCVHGIGSGHLDRLRALTEEHPNEANVRANYARVLRHFDNHKEAAAEFLTASKSATHMKDKLEFMSGAARQYRAAGNDETADNILEAIRNLGTSNTGQEADLIEALISASPQKVNDYSLALRERLVELRPEGSSLRFSLAYDQSDYNNEDIGLYHYKKIPEHDRTGTGWNNLGVSLHHFKMSAKSVKAFREAEAMEDTLAMANLGDRLLLAGFSDEAQEICDRALAISDYHKNVGHLLARLQDNPDKENELEENVLKAARGKVEFYRALGTAFAQTSPESLTGEWMGPDCVLHLEYLSRGKIRLTGSYEKSANPLSIGLFGSSETQITEKVEYSGGLSGRAIVAYVSRRSARPTLLEGAGNKVIMYVSDADANEIKACEFSSSTSTRFYVLRRTESPAQLSGSS